MYNIVTMENFNYPRSHELAGISQEMIDRHPGGSIVEIGGGTKRRFREVLNRFPVINIDTDPLAIGNLVLPHDMNALGGNMSDERIRPYMEQGGGAGTIIMSHSLYDLRPETVRELIPSAIKNINAQGDAWIFRLGPERLAQACANTYGAASPACKNEQDSLNNSVIALDEAVDSVGSDIHVSRATLTFLQRKDVREDTKKWKPSNFWQRFWAAADKKKINFMIEEGFHDVTDRRTEDLDEATTKNWALAQQIILLSKKAPEATAAMWSRLHARTENILEQNMIWLKANHKKK